MLWKIMVFFLLVIIFALIENNNKNQAGRSATSIVATDSVFLFTGQSEIWLSFSILKGAERT